MKTKRKKKETKSSKLELIFIAMLMQRGVGRSLMWFFVVDVHVQFFVCVFVFEQQQHRVPYQDFMCCCTNSVRCNRFTDTAVTASVFVCVAAVNVGARFYPLAAGLRLERRRGEKKMFIERRRRKRNFFSVFVLAVQMR